MLLLKAELIEQLLYAKHCPKHFTQQSQQLCDLTFPNHTVHQGQSKNETLDWLVSKPTLSIHYYFSINYCYILLSH